MPMRFRVSSAAAAVISVALLASPQADARVFDGGITHEELRQLLIDAGVQAATVEAESPKPGDVPQLVIIGGPARWYVQFMACKEGRCGDLHLHAGFDLETVTPQATVDVMNSEMLGWLSANLFIDDEGDPIFQADVNTDGASGRNILYSARVFDLAVRCVSHRIGFEDGPEECPKMHERFEAIRNQSVDDGDLSQVRISASPGELDRMLRANGFSPIAAEQRDGTHSYRVKHDGVFWSAVVSDSTAEQVNGAIFLVTACLTCPGEGPRRANAYNAEFRWLTAAIQGDTLVGMFTLPLSGGVSEDAIGMMLRSFQGWAKSFDSDVPK